MKNKEALRLSFYGINNGPHPKQRKEVGTYNIKIGYAVYKNQEEVISVVEARCLLVSVVESLLREINTDLRLKGYLTAYPFTSDRIFLSLFFEDENNVGLGSGGIESIFLYEGKIQYERYEIQEYTPPIPLGRNYLVHEESYEEALDIVKKQGCLRLL